MFGKFKRKKVRAADQGHRMEMLEDRRLMTVSNVQVTAPATVDEGTTFEVEFHAESDGTITQWVIDFGDGNGPVTLPGYIESLNVNYPDGERTHAITATAYDEWSSSGSGGTSVSVQNVAPTFTVNAQEEAFVDKPFWVSVTDFFEPGADTLSQWEVNWGDGTVET